MIRRREFGALAMPLLTGCRASTEPVVRLGADTILQESFLVLLADALGFFREVGVSVVLDRLVGSRLAESIVAGTSDLGYQTFTAALQLSQKGQTLRSIFVGSAAMSAMLVTAEKSGPQMDRIEDLRGATIGMAGFGSPQHHLLLVLLRRAGLKPDDVTIVVYGSGTSAAASLQFGKVDAGIINHSAFEILKRQAPGIRVLADPRTRRATTEITGVESYPNLCLLATANWVDRNPDVSRKLVKAMIRTMRWVRGHSLEEVYRSLPAALRTDNAKGDIESLRVLIDALSPDGRMPPAAPEGVLRYLGESSAKFDLAATYTNRFVDEAS